MCIRMQSPSVLSAMQTWLYQRKGIWSGISRRSTRATIQTSQLNHLCVPRKVQELKSQLAAQQFVFTRPNTKSKAATIASYHVSRVLAKGKKSFKDGEIVKEAFMEAADVLFAD